MVRKSPIVRKEPPDWYLQLIDASRLTAVTITSEKIVVKPSSSAGGLIQYLPPTYPPQFTINADRDEDHA